jgi:alpha/beta superfamily hydrolase
MSESVVIPSDRDVRGSLDSPEGDACVVACPPHPQMGGNRSDPRLQAVSDALDCACLRFDYGAWDEGPGELADTRDAYAWARQRYDSVGLFGYSFGGCLALVAAAHESATGTAPFAVAALAPADRITDDIDAVAAIEDIDCPMAVVYGERDTTVDAEAVAAAVEKRGGTVDAMSADHHFVGQAAKVGKRVGEFFREVRMA